VGEIIAEIQKSISSVRPDDVERIIDTLVLTKARGNKVMVLGSGRSGLVARSFALRLMHLGFQIYVLGETITPAVGKGDLMLAISGSGTTELVVSASRVAKRVGARVLAITSHPDSPLGELADYVIQLRGRTKVAHEEDYVARQMVGEHEPLAPLGTVFEDSCMVFFDGIIVELMHRLEETEADLRKRHATIE